jgi:hypothetical protein
MKVSLLSILFVWTTVLYGQSNLSPAKATPIFDADSLAQVMLNELIETFNSHEKNPEDLLTNRYEFFCLTNSCGWNKEYFAQSGEAALKNLDTRLTDYFNQYEKELRILEKSKSRVDKVHMQDFKNRKVEWNSGYLNHSVRHLVISFDCNNHQLKFKHIAFHVHIFSESPKDEDILKVTWIKN